MKKLTRILAGLSVLTVLMICMTAVSFAGTAEDKVTVSFRAGMPGSLDYVNENLEVTGDLFEKAFPDMAANDAEQGVSIADALVAAHIKKYGEDKVSEYFAMKGKDWMSKQFGHDLVGFYYVNKNSSSTGVNSDTLNDGDVVFAGSYSNDTYADLYSEFDADTIEAPVNTPIELDITCDNWGSDVVPQTAALKQVEPDTCEMKDVAGATYENGKFTFTFTEKGTYYLSATGSVKYESSWGGEMTGGFTGAWVKVVVAPTDEITVNFKAGMPGSFDYINEKLKVKGNLAEMYFPEIAANEPDGVSFADALVAAHIAKYGEKKAADNLVISNGSWGTSMVKQFGHDIVGFYYANNQSLPGSVSDAIKAGDSLYAGAYNDFNYADFYCYFDKASYTATTGKALSMTLTCDAFGTPLTPTTVALKKVTPSTGKMAAIAGATYKDGKVTVKFTKAGTYYVSVDASAPGMYDPDAIGKGAGAYAKVVVKDATPAKPVIKTAKRKTKKTAVVAWKKAANAKKYQVAYKAKGAKKWTIKKTSKTKITLKKLKAKKKYQVKVLAINGSAKSKYSKVKTIKIKK